MRENNREMAMVEQTGGKFERYIVRKTMGALRTSNIDAICYEDSPTCSSYKHLLGSNV